MRRESQVPGVEAELVQGPDVGDLDAVELAARKAELEALRLNSPAPRRGGS